MLANCAGHAFFAPRLKVGADFFWQNVTVNEGRVHLPPAHVGDLVDELRIWPGGGRTCLDGFTYDSITRDAPMDAATRLTWLDRVSTLNRRFLPQPHARAAGTLARVGHEAEAGRSWPISLGAQGGRGERTAGGVASLPCPSMPLTGSLAARLI